MIRNPIFSALLFTLAVSSARADSDAQRMIREQGPVARKIIDEWQAREPQREVRKVHVVVWTPSDREPAPRYRERLSAILLDIRKFYADEMERMGFGPRTFQLDGKEGMVNIHLVKGEKPYADYAKESGDMIRKECIPSLKAAGIDPEDSTVVIFCNMSVWDGEARKMTQNSPYYAGGTHLHGTAWQVDSPLLDLSLLARKEPMLQDGQYGKISEGKYNSIFIGGIAHELGHAVGLPHNCEREDEKEAFGIALMGAGNRTYKRDLRGEGKGSFLTLAHALRLAAHPLFCGSVKGSRLPASAVPSELTVKDEGDGFTFSGSVAGDPPVYGVVAYMDPAGGDDYDATSTSAVPDAGGRFSLFCHALKPGSAGVLRVVYLQANGVASGFLSATPFRYPYSVGTDGKVDVSVMEAMLRLNPVTDALLRNDAAAARSAAMQPAVRADGKLAALADRLVSSIGKPALTDPADVAGRTVELSTLKAAREEVGYGKLSRDRLREAPVLLTSGGSLFTHGFFAHAPSVLEWDLGTGGWGKLKGKAGLPDGSRGSVEFIIKGDGKVLWQSGKVEEGPPKSYEVDIRGVRRLTLESTDAGDGRSSDWSLWLEPAMERE